MRVAIFCEYSARVRDAFRRLGHDAWSFDLLPCEGDDTYHVQGDCLEYLDEFWQWDLIIAHPPCTFLTNAANKHLYIDGRKENGRDEQRWHDMRDGAAFYNRFVNAKARCKCIENPVMGEHARKLIDNKGVVQYVQPYMFGTMETKQTGLRLINLPKLKATNDVKAETMALPYRERAKVHYMSPSPDRWKHRSRTYQCIADAMAAQWGELE